jgi:nicotinamide phosphoribosyltransferase
VLNHVRVIQGDGVNPSSIHAILEYALAGGYSATNLTFGMGGALLQQLNRDTQKFAMKCSEVTIDGARVPIYKDPVTDHSKRSKAGRLDLVATPQGYETIVLNGKLYDPRSVLRTVFENGVLRIDESLDEIRARANTALQPATA